MQASVVEPLNMAVTAPEPLYTATRALPAPDTPIAVRLSPWQCSAARAVVLSMCVCVRACACVRGCVCSCEGARDLLVEVDGFVAAMPCLLSSDPHGARSTLAADTLRLAL